MPDNLSTGDGHRHSGMFSPPTRSLLGKFSPPPPAEGKTTNCAEGTPSSSRWRQGDAAWPAIRARHMDVWFLGDTDAPSVRAHVWEGRSVPPDRPSHPPATGMPSPADTWC